MPNAFPSAAGYGNLLQKRPVTRAGVCFRIFAEGEFDGLDPSKRAEIMLDNIFADSDKFIELSWKYAGDPMDLATKQNFI